MTEIPPRPSRLLAERTALVVGGGQTPGVGLGNGRATALLFGREGAHVIVADKDGASAEDTAALIQKAGGSAESIEVDITRDDDVVRMIGTARAAHGRLDVLHNNVGASIAAGDAELLDVTSDAFDRVMTLNLRGMAMTCKHALPIMRAQRAGAIVNISSIAAVIDYRNIAYKTSKAGVNALTTTLAISNAEFGIRVNAIMPGLIETPMAIESRVGLHARARDEVVAARNAHVPLGARMGTAWDVARAALFLASDEAAFVTGVLLAVDGGQALKVG